MGSNLMRLQGRQEHDIAMYSGLRTARFNAALTSIQGLVFNGAAAGGGGGAAVTVWTDIALINRAIQFTSTLCVLVTQDTPTTGTVQVRIRGYNQFGEYQEEITPVVAFVAKTSNFIYCAKVWSYIVQVSYKSAGLDSGGDAISLGPRWDWTRTNDGTNEHLFGRNLGIAIPMQLGRRVDPSVAIASFGQPPGFGGVMTDTHTGAGAAGNLYEDYHPRWTTPRGYARAIATISAAPADGDTVTLDGLAYTFKTVLTAAARDVLIGASRETAVQNLYAAMIRDAALAGTGYSVATTEHPTVRPGPIRADGELHFMAKAPGARGNLIAVAEVSGVIAFLHSTTALEGGYDYPVEAIGLSVYDVTGAALAGALTHHQPTEYAVGWSEAGWSGPSEKIHFLRQTSVAQWAIADEVFVRMNVRTADVASH